METPGLVLQLSRGSGRGRETRARLNSMGALRGCFGRVAYCWCFWFRSCSGLTLLRLRMCYCWMREIECRVVKGLFGPGLVNWAKNLVFLLFALKS
uniref:Uncharacterized protein n=1 Tax=Solanum lycopersicum TaxID=4081 RepID=A0A3Q7EFG0_SOLLC